MKDYPINVFFSEEDRAYVADIPDLEACSALGATPEEALREVLQAKQPPAPRGNPFPSRVIARHTTRACDAPRPRRSSMLSGI